MTRIAFAGLLIALPAAALPPRVSASLAGRAAAGVARVEVSVRASSETAALLQARGARLAGDLAYLAASPAEIAALAQLPGVRAVEPARRLFPVLDHSLPESGVLVARREEGLDGRGVLVGIIDTGCDFRHPDLRDGDGRTRLDALLDVARPRDGRHPEYAGLRGAVFLRDEIDAQLGAEAMGRTPAVAVSSRDVDGHGTHLAGIAVGSGLATGRGLPALRYVGVAPGAALVCVQAADDGHGFSEPDVLDGVRFVLARAQALGSPAVINLSLSADGGPHDGTTSFERALAALLPEDMPGRALVAAAGNDGARDLHAGGFALDGRVEVEITVGTGLAATSRVASELWFSGPPPALALLAPDGQISASVGAGGQLAGSLPAAGTAIGRLAIDNAPRGQDPDNGRYEAAVVIEGPPGKPPASGTWRLRLEGRVARWDAWLVGVPRSATSPRYASRLDVDGRAASPAFTRSAISVGAYVSRNQWVNRAGATVARATSPGQWSTFTGSGPSSDGRFVPDLVAPGDFIAAALSRDAPPTAIGSAFFSASDPELLWADDGLHGLLRGTSQAAPHVAGAVALLLQAEPRLDGRRLRELLRTSARRLSDEPGFSPRGGFGRLDAGAAARLLRRRPVGELDRARSSVGVNRDVVAPGASVVVTSVVPRDGAGAPLGGGHVVVVKAAPVGSWAPFSAGATATASDAGFGRYEAALPVRGPRGGALIVVATVDGVELDQQPTVWLATSRETIGRPQLSLAGGGCGLPARPRGAPLHSPPLLLLGLVLLLARRRRATRLAPRRPNPA